MRICANAQTNRILIKHITIMVNLKSKIDKATKNNVDDSPIMRSIANSSKLQAIQEPKRQAPVNEIAQLKAVQTKISIEDYQRLMDIKVKRNQRLIVLLNEAIVYWLDHQ